MMNMRALRGSAQVHKSLTTSDPRRVEPTLGIVSHRPGRLAKEKLPFELLLVEDTGVFK